VGHYPSRTACKSKLITSEYMDLHNIIIPALLHRLLYGAEERTPQEIRPLNHAFSRNAATYKGANCGQ
jgi:hypothetical protein